MHDPRAAFRHAPFRHLQVAKVLMVVAIHMISVAVGWQVYAQTGRALDLGFVGLVQFVPHLLLFPVTGNAVDRSDRRALYTWCMAGMLVASALLAAGAWWQIPVGGVYALLLVLAVPRAFAAPTQAALLPMTVPAETYGNAVTWSSSLWSLSAMVGPALGGLVYMKTGSATAVYLVAAGLLALAALFSLRMRPRPHERSREAPSFRDFFAGLRFIRGRPVLYGAILLDLFAVLFGGAVALLPIYAKDILHAGPETLGLLRAAPSVGAAATAIFLSFVPIKRRAGPKLLLAVAGFGLATIAFATSTSTLGCFLALLVVGLTDEVSVVIRANLTQLSTPEAMRGRVSAAEFVFIGVSNEIGELESGVAAEWGGPVFAALTGGVGSLLVVAYTALFVPAVRDVDELTREALSK